MSTPVVLGLDVGGANLKAATPDGRAVSVPFALWKHPERLPGALTELVARFPDANELAVTMTGELCDCFETKRQGVNAILDATEHAAAGRPVRVWGTDGAFHTVEEARAKHLTVAAANWHALATFAGRYVRDCRIAKLIDIGSTTTDLIPLHEGRPATKGLTDFARLESHELVYTGVRRTPVAAVLGQRPVSNGSGLVCSELFATTLDAYLMLGDVPEAPDDFDTADGRPATRAYAHARLARMMGGDIETHDEAVVVAFARDISAAQLNRLDTANYWSGNPGGIFILSGGGEFLGQMLLDQLTYEIKHVVSLNDELGPQVSACAPAYAVAVLAAEGPGSSEPGA